MELSGKHLSEIVNKTHEDTQPLIVSESNEDIRERIKSLEKDVLYWQNKVSLILSLVS